MISLKHLKKTVLSLGLLSLALGSALAAGIPDKELRPVSFTHEGRYIGDGVAFSPYHHGQGPGLAAPSDAEILADLRLVAPHWGLLRTYDSVPMVGRTLALIRKHKLPFRMMLGCWVKPEKSPADKIENEAEMERAIRFAREYPEIVMAVIVGNETQVDWSAYRCSSEHLIQCIRRVRTAIPQPVTTADDYNFWNKDASAAVAAEVDFITLHMYALWNGRQLGEAMAWTGAVYDDIVRRHPKRYVIIGETGWATKNDKTRSGPGDEGTLMKAPATEDAQYEYLKQHYAWTAQRRVPAILFEAFDEEWKGGGESTGPDVAEKHWGVFNVDRSPKSSFARFLKEKAAATAPTH